MRTLIVFCALVLTTTSSASELAYVKTDNPRDTLSTFMEAMNTYRLGVLKEDGNKIMRINDALRTFAPPQGNMIVSQREQEQAAILLKEAIDRVIVVDLNRVPDSPQGVRWRLKNTELVIKKQTSGDREGEWLITESSWRRAPLYYKRVKNLPYLEGSGQGAAYSRPWMDRDLPRWAKTETLGLMLWQWLGLALGLVAGLLIRLLVGFLLGIYQSIAFRNPESWRRHLVEKIVRPLSLLGTAVFWYFGLHALVLEGLAFKVVNATVQFTFGIAFTWMAYEAVAVLGQQGRARAALTPSELDDQLVPILESAAKFTVVVLGLLLVLQNMGLNVFSLLAGLGLGGLAFALAAKDTAANLFGSIMILVDRPFKIGDWVKLSSVEGTVEEVGFRSTRIRTFYNSLVTVPNATMANADIDNLGARIYRRTSLTLDVTYQTTPEQMESFVEGIRKIIADHPITRKDMYHVYFSGYADSSLKVLVYFFFVTNEWGEELKARQEVFMAIFKLAASLNVEFAYPTQTLHLTNEQST